MIRVRDRLVAWFLSNPDEELTRADVELRWGITTQGAQEALKMLRNDGLVIAAREGHKTAGLGVTHVYRASPRLLSLHHSTT